MAEPTLAPPPRRPSLLSPWVVFPLLGLVLVASVLLAPTTGRQGDSRLTTLSTTSQGAQGFAELLGRLGWAIERDSAPPGLAPLDPRAIYAVLDPPEELTGREVHRYLDAVRAGAGLLVIVRDRGDPFADSLGVATGGAAGGRMRIDSATVRGCPRGEKTFGISWPQGAVYSYWLVPFRPIRGDTVHFHAVSRPLTRRERRAAGVGDVDVARIENDTTRRPAPAALGMPLGRGRVVAVADPDWLRNDVLRVCRWHAGVQAARMVEWLGGAEAAPRRVVFDEWHQGRGAHASAMRTLGRFLFRTPIGTALTTAIVALLVLLAAAALRPLAPVATERIERRSPLEHVGALAHAYEQVGATRAVSRRLVRGLRRRTAAGTLRGMSDEAYLDTLAGRHPSLAADIGVVRGALTQPRTPEQLLGVGQAVANIERIILQ